MYFRLQKKGVTFDDAIIMSTLGEDGRRDPVVDWKAFEPDKIPTKGGSLEKMPQLFLDTLQSLESQRIQKDFSKIAKKKQNQYPEFLSIIEFGCGCGELSSSLQLRGHSVYGIDVNEAAIQRARATADANVQAQKRADTTSRDDGEIRAFGSVLGSATFEVADIANSMAGSSLLQQQHQNHDFCVLQLLLSVVGGHLRRKCALQTAHNSLKPGGTLYLSCSGVSDTINTNYKALYEKDASELLAEYGEHSYYSRDESSQILYITHHFTANELESLLSEAGFGQIRIEQKKETSSRRPEELAYFLYATAIAE